MAAKQKKPRRKSKAAAPVAQPDDVVDGVVAPQEEVASPPPAASAPKKKKSKKEKKKKDASTKKSSDDVDASAKKSSKKSKKKVEPPTPMEAASDDNESEGEDGDDMKLTLAALDAVSDEEDSEYDGKGDAEEEDEDLNDGEGDMQKEALALRNMIQGGQFDDMLKKVKKSKDSKKDGKKTVEKDYESVEEEDSESKGEPDEDAMDTSDAKDDDVGEKIEDSKKEEEDQSGSSSDEDEAKTSKRNTQTLALATALQAADRHLPWAETFAMVPPTPLPFGPLPMASGAVEKKRKRAADEEEDDEDEYVDIHDDLKREVAFYDNALESVLLAREKAEEVGIPFTRPDDFFAEMVKSDDHMAKIKDRLIFETKKMEAVERRKSNKEQTVMAKERHAHRLAEKARSKKDHMKDVDNWKKSAERGRSDLGGKVRDDDEDRLRGIGGKRMAANKKYGFGGEKSRFKQTDQKSLNDTSGYNPRGGFGGIGTKSQGSAGGKKGGGKKRPGKRARDANR